MIPIFNNSQNSPTTTSIASTCTDIYGQTISVTSADDNFSTSISYCQRHNHVNAKDEETKDQKVARIAKEKMLASWKTHNQKTEKIIKVVQVCKPKHKLSFMGRKRF